MKLRWSLLLVLCAFSLGCKSIEAEEAEDREELTRLGENIRGMIARVDCGSPDDCRYIPFGAKPCGGPWRYLVYSISHVDTSLLRARVAEYNQFENRMNKKYGYMSDCSVPPTPVLDCVNGKCVNIVTVIH